MCVQCRAHQLHELQAVCTALQLVECVYQLIYCRLRCEKVSVQLPLLVKASHHQVVPLYPPCSMWACIWPR